MIVTLYLAGLLALLVVSGSFSAAETAIVGISHSTVHRLVKEKRWGAHSLHNLKRDMRRTLTTILIANNVMNTIITSLSTLLAVEVLGSVWLGVSIGAIFFFVLMFGEIFPKTFTTVYMESVAHYFAPWIEVLAFLFSPFIFLVQFVPDRILKQHELGNKIVSEKELHELMELGIAENVFEKGEVKMIKKVLQFNEIPIRSIMTPMDQVAKLNAEESVEDAIKIVSLHNHTRYPLVDEKGRIIGSLRVRNLFKHAYSGKRIRVVELADKPLFLDEEIKIDDALGMMKKFGQHIAYVTNERDKVLGVITTEDVLEELVGEY